MPRPPVVLLVASIASGAACSSAQKPTEALTSTIVFVPRPAAETCRIPGPRANLTLRVEAGTEEIVVMVRGAPVIVVPRGPGAVSVAVTGAIEFEGPAPDLEFFPSAPVVVASGVVQLGPMSVLRETSPRGADLVARTVDVSLPFELSEVTVPCGALSFVGSGDPSEDAHRGVGAPPLRRPSCPDPCTYYTTPEVLDFHASPGGDARVRLTGSTIVSELERRGRWARVSTEDFVHLDGAQLTGWVDPSRLTRIDGGIGFSGGRGFLAPLLDTVGHGIVTGPGIFQGPAHVDAGTAVFSLPAGGVRWATVGDGQAEIEVVIRPGEDRARVWSAPFLPHLDKAWVAVTAVHALPVKPEP